MFGYYDSHRSIVEGSGCGKW